MQPKKQFYEYFSDSVPPLSRQDLEDMLLKAGAHSVAMTLITGRCGSTWLASLIENHQLMGPPYEVFNEDAVRIDTSSFREYLATMLACNTRNGIFAFHINPPRLAYLIESLLQEDVFHSPRFRFAFMARRDIVAQAISFVEALETNVWHTTSASEASAAKGTAIPEKKVTEYVMSLLRQEQQALRFLQARTRDFLTIFYEDLYANPATALQTFYLHHGQKLDIAKLRMIFEKSSTKKLCRSSTLENWYNYVGKNSWALEMVKQRWSYGVSIEANQRLIDGRSSARETA